MTWSPELRRQGFPARSVLLHGTDRAGRLVRELKENPVDLLVVGSHGHGLVRDLLFGQTVDKVRHGLNIPMMITRPGKVSEERHSPERSAGGRRGQWSGRRAAYVRVSVSATHLAEPNSRHAYEDVSVAPATLF